MKCWREETVDGEQESGSGRQHARVFSQSNSVGVFWFWVCPGDDDGEMQGSRSVKCHLKGSIGMNGSS
jgi:hypothetical protein